MRTWCLTAALPAVLLIACSNPTPKADAMAPSMKDLVPDAVATLKTPDGQVAGRVVLADSAEGVRLQVQASGLSPGAHGFHIHANGVCAPGPDAATGEVVPFGAAGGHFDPGATHNHGKPGDPPTHVHAGELANLVADAAGAVRAEQANPHVTLAAGKMSILGRTLVVHAQADDYETDPAGNSGGRVLCGLVEPASGGPITGRTTFEGSNVFPEGAVVDPGTQERYVGSSKEGHLYRWRAGAEKAELYQTGGAPGRQGAFGLAVDADRQLWVAGGPNGTLAVVDLATAITRRVMKVPPGPQTFINDLAIANGTAYVTDSFRPVVYRVPRGGTALEPWLDLTGTPVRYKPNEVNLNGIVAAPDGRWLLAIQSATGQLWRIDPRTRAVSEVRLEGGPLPHGDGLVLRNADDLYVVRNEEGEITRVALSADATAGRVVLRLRDPRLRYPTTAAATPEGLLVVNGQLDRQKTPPPLLPFDAVVVDWPR